MSTALRRSDPSDALTLVREAGQAPDSDAFRRHVLERLPRLVPTTMGVEFQMAVTHGPGGGRDAARPALSAVRRTAYGQPRSR